MESEKDRDGGGFFPQTRWSLIASIKDTADEPAARRAQGELLQLYWQPLYAYARQRGCSAEEAEDVVQNFYC